MHDGDAEARCEPSREDGSAGVAARVQTAQDLQRARAAKLNAHLTPGELMRDAPVGREGERLLAQARARLGLSARGYHRVVRVARTIADLEGLRTIEPRHVAEALQMRRALASSGTATE